MRSLFSQREGPRTVVVHNALNSLGSSSPLAVVGATYENDAPKPLQVIQRLSSSLFPIMVLSTLFSLFSAVFGIACLLCPWFSIDLDSILPSNTRYSSIVYTQAMLALIALGIIFSSFATLAGGLLADRLRILTSKNAAATIFISTRSVLLCQSLAFTLHILGAILGWAEFSSLSTSKADSGTGLAAAAVVSTFISSACTVWTNTRLKDAALKYSQSEVFSISCLLVGGVPNSCW
jgi:hypothetical protein